jgi:protein phosphatase
MKIGSFKYSDKGSRIENQDTVEALELNGFYIACVADGVGGGNCGKLASQTIVDLFISNKYDTNINLTEVIETAHNKIKYLQSVNTDCSGMATTFTGCIIDGNNLKIVHVGDSRLCILRGNGIQQLTDSHTEAYRLYRAGKIKFEDIKNYPRRHILESAVGIDENLTIQSLEFGLLQGDRILLTTDGVHDIISKQEFRDLSMRSDSVTVYGYEIVSLLKSKKITDNVSFVILSVE